MSSPIGPIDDPPASPGGPGSLNAKTRLLTRQMTELSAALQAVSAALSGGIASTLAAVSGSAALTAEQTAAGLLTLSPLQRAARQGHGFLAATPRLVIPNHGGFLRVTLQNGSASGLLCLQELTLLHTAAALVWGSFSLTPAGGLPAASGRVRNLLLASPAPVTARLKADFHATVPLSGGLLLCEQGFVPLERAPWPLPLLLAPGAVLGINLTFADSAEALLTASFTEE